MSMLRLLNAVTLDQKQLIIIAAAAVAVLAVIITIVACSVRARKKRKERAVAQTSEKVAVNVDVSEQIEENPIVEDEQEQLSDNVAEFAADEHQEEEIAAEQTVADDYSSSVENTDVDDEESDDEDEEISEDELEELASDDGGEDVEEEVAIQLADDDNGEGGIVYRRTVYNRSFLARITQASDEVKERYSELKNYLLSYQKVKSAISWKHESFRFGRSTFADIVMRGKKLCLRFATDPKRFDDTKYIVVDLSVRSPKSKLPCMYRITSDRRVKYAKEIIDLLMRELSTVKLDEPTVENYVMPYRTTEALIDDGLIRVTVIEGVESTDNNGATTVETVKKVVDDVAELPKRDFKILPKVEVAEVNVMSDAEATNIIEYKVVKRKKSKGSKGIINIDVLSRKFPSGAHISLDVLRENRIIPNNVNYIKVLANGVLDKPLIVEADDFSLQAVKMIALTGGRVIRTSDK